MITKVKNKNLKQMSDIKKIEDLMQGIINETCWGARLSFGDEFRLEIGNKLPDPILKGKEKGMWRLRAKASDWSLKLRGNEIVNSKDNLIQIKQNISLIDENRIITFEIDWPKLGLEITLNNEMKLKINPVWDDDYELAHWGFLMPNTMFLQVGPKSTWSYYPSDIPIT